MCVEAFLAATLIIWHWWKWQVWFAFMNEAWIVWQTCDWCCTLYEPRIATLSQTHTLFIWSGPPTPPSLEPCKWCSLGWCRPQPPRPAWTMGWPRGWETEGVEHSRSAPHQYLPRQYKLSGMSISNTLFALNSPAMKFFSALIELIFWAEKRHLGRDMNELWEMSTLSSCVSSFNSSGNVDIRLCDKFRSAKGV